MRRIILLSLVFFLLSAKDSYNLQKSFPAKNSSFFSTDQLGNLYIVSDNTLYKYYANSEIISNYRNNQLGKLAFADVSNPFKVLLFFPDFSQIVIVDNKLSETTRIDLRQLDIQQIGAVCTSYNDALWVYDTQDQNLKRIDNNLKITNISQKLGQIIPEPLAPDLMTENENFLYVNNPASGILVFDKFGTYLKTLPLKGLKSFQFLGNQLLFLKKDSSAYQLKSYNLGNLEEKNILLPPLNPKDTLRDARIHQQVLFLFKKEIIDLYSF